MKGSLGETSKRINGGVLEGFRGILSVQKQLEVFRGLKHVGISVIIHLHWGRIKVKDQRAQVIV